MKDGCPIRIASYAIIVALSLIQLSAAFANDGCLARATYAQAISAMVAGKTALADGRYAAAWQSFRNGIDLLPPPGPGCFVNSRVSCLDDTGQHMAIANGEVFNGRYKIAAGLAEGVLDTRLYLYGARYCPGMPAIPTVR